VWQDKKNAPGFVVHYFNATVFVDINVVYLINKKIVRFFCHAHIDESIKTIKRTAINGQVYNYLYFSTTSNF